MDTNKEGPQKENHSSPVDTCGEASQKANNLPDKYSKISLIVSSISALCAVVAMITSICSNSFNYGRLAEKIDSGEKDRVEIKASISGLEGNVNTLSNGMTALTERAQGIERNLDMLNQVVFNFRPTPEFESTITKTYSAVDAPYSDGIIQLGAKTKIAYSKSIPDAVYTAEQLADQALLLPYTEGGKEVYFYGQVDENGSWDGHCVVNIYEDDKLSLITDADYDNGKLLKCKQVFPDSLPNGDDIWVISNRTLQDGFSEGVSKRYFRSGDYDKDFTIDSVTTDDVVDADTFEKNVGAVLEGYYSGNIANGSYNDDTGNAYYVQYYMDGTVDTLYVGCFKDGNFADTTGNAWMIGNNGEGTPYCYYSGPFINAKAMDDIKYWENNISVERVNELIEEHGVQFDCNLKWAPDSV